MLYQRIDAEDYCWQKEEPEQRHTGTGDGDVWMSSFQRLFESLPSGLSQAVSSLLSHSWRYNAVPGRKDIPHTSKKASCGGVPPQSLQ